MFDFWNAIKKNRFEEEVKKIEDEINRSKRFNYSFGVFVVDASEAAPKGLSGLIPGNTISFHVMRKYIRGYDILNQIETE
jgi:predicted metallo-beta-lactamase superfamily hydrolase